MPSRTDVTRHASAIVMSAYVSTQSTVCGDAGAVVHAGVPRWARVSARHELPSPQPPQGLSPQPPPGNVLPERARE